MGYICDMQKIVKTIIKIGCAFLTTLSLTAQITLQVIDLSERNTTSPIYLAGNINGWNPGDNHYLLQAMDGGYQLSFTPSEETISYKFTRGNWSNVESTDSGADIQNRNIIYQGEPITVIDTIWGWKDAFGKVELWESSAAENIVILSDSFPISKLERHRRIWIYLPPDYENSTKPYPVIYMHDGQNLFDQKTSYSDEWGVDETMNELFVKTRQSAIIIGIDNGGKYRTTEYTPWSHPEYGGGQGDAYVDFIVNELKPYVDNHYRTLPDRSNTAIIGSSLGGLISLYAVLKYQGVFGKAGVLSPSLWFTEDIFVFAQQTKKVEDAKFFFLAGALESETVIPNVKRMISILKKSGFRADEIFLSTHADGKHQESYWKREFGKCVQWLFE